MDAEIAAQALCMAWRNLSVLGEGLAFERGSLVEGYLPRDMFPEVYKYVASTMKLLGENRKHAFWFWVQGEDGGYEATYNLPAEVEERHSLKRKTPPTEELPIARRLRSSDEVPDSESEGSAVEEEVEQFAQIIDNGFDESMSEDESVVQNSSEEVEDDSVVEQTESEDESVEMSDEEAQFVKYMRGAKMGEDDEDWVPGETYGH